MSRKHRIVHFISFVALVANLFAPMLTLPVVSAGDPLDLDSNPPPIVEYNTPENDGEQPDDGNSDISLPSTDAGDGDGDGDTGGAPVVIEQPAPLIPLTAKNPTYSALACVDGVGFANSFQAATTPGITYHVGQPGADGNFTITATLDNPGTHTWGTDMVDWTVNGNEAKYYGSLDLCPPPVPAETEEATEEATDEATEESTEEAADEATEEATGEAGDATEEATEEAADKTDGLQAPAKSDGNLPQMSLDQDDKDEPVEAKAVTPVVPVITEVCQDGIPVLEYDTGGGIDYHLQGPTENGEFHLLAMLQADYAWDEGISGWEVSDNVAVLSDVIVDVPNCMSSSMRVGPMNNSNPTPGYTIQKTVNPGSVAQGDRITYTIDIGWGPLVANTPFTVNDQVPSLLYNVVSGPGDCATIPTHTVTCERLGSGNDVRWAVNPMGYAGSVRITVTATVPDDAAEEIVTNTVFIAENPSVTAENTFTVLAELPPETVWNPGTITPVLSVCPPDGSGIPTIPGLDIPDNIANIITYNITLGNPNQPGALVVVEALLAYGYIFPEDVSPWTRNANDRATIGVNVPHLASCAQSPQVPMIGDSVCIAGAPSAPGITLPGNHPFITYALGNPSVVDNGNGTFTITMTATLKGEHDGWTDKSTWPDATKWKIDGDTATYKKTVDAGECEKSAPPTFQPTAQMCISNVTNNGKIQVTLSDKGGFSFWLDNETPARTANHTYDNLAPRAYTLYVQLKDGFAVPDMTGWSPVSGKSVTWSKQINIDSGKCQDSKAPSFETTALECVDHTNVNGKIKVTLSTQGGFSFWLDQETPARSANHTYSNLTPGSYTLNVKLLSGYEIPTSMSGWTKVQNETNQWKRTITVGSNPCGAPVLPTITVVNASCPDGSVNQHKLSIPKSGVNGLTVTDVTGQTLHANGGWGNYFYSGSTNQVVTVTVTAENGFTMPSQEDLPEGWNREGDKKATYTHTFTKASCTPVKPKLTPPTAGVCVGGTYQNPIIPIDSTIVKVNGVDVVAITYAVTSGPDADGNYTITATWQPGFSIATPLPPGWGQVYGGVNKAVFDGEVDLNKCDMPDLPTFTIVNASCPDGSVNQHTFTISKADGLSITGITAGGSTVDLNDDGGWGEYTFTGTDGTAVVVNFSLAENHAWPTDFPTGAQKTAGWKKTGDTTATFKHDFDAASCDDPGLPTLTMLNASCPDGSVNEHVLTLLQGTGVNITSIRDSNGDVTLLSGGGWGEYKSNGNGENIVIVTFNLDPNYGWSADFPTPEQQLLGWANVVGNPAAATYTHTFNGANCAPAELPQVEIQPAVCELGEPTDFSLTIPAEGVNGVSISGIMSNGTTVAPNADDGWGEYTFDGGGTHEVIVTFTVEDSFTMPAQADMSAGWDRVDNSTATYTHMFNAVTCDPAVTIEKTQSGEADGDGNVVYAPEDPIHFTITVTNSGDGAAEVTFRDPLPMGLPNSAWTIDEGASNYCSISGGVLTCEDVPLTPSDADGGQSFSVNVSALITVDRPECGPYTNQAYVTKPAAAYSDVVAFQIECEPGFTVLKTSARTIDADNDGKISLGDTITYTITVTNTGNGDLTDLMLNDVFEGHGNLSWVVPADEETVPTVPYDDSVDLIATYVVLQEDVDAGEITNCAFIEGMTLIADGDNCVTDDIPQDPEVSITKRAIGSPGAPGVDADNPKIAFEIVFTNDGDITVESALIDDSLVDLPAGHDWTVSVVNDDSSPAATTSSLPYPVTNLDPGGSVTLLIESPVILPEWVQLPNSAWCGEWNNTASVTGTYANTDSTTFNTSSNQATYTVNCTGLTITKASSVAEQTPLTPGTDFEYTIVVTNTGNTPVYNVTVTDPVPTQLIVGNLGDDCSVDDTNIVTCYIGVLAANPVGVATFTIPVTVPDVGEITLDQCVDINNTAVIGADFMVNLPVLLTLNTPGITPPNHEIESNPVANIINCEPSFTVEKDEEATTRDLTLAGPDNRLDAGDELTYTFKVTNTGDVALYNVQLDDLLPGVVFEGDNPGTYVIDVLPAGDVVGNPTTVTATWIVTQQYLDASEVVNCVEAMGNTSDDGEGESSYADDCYTSLLEHDPELDLVKTGQLLPNDSGRVESGDVIEYTFTIQNTGNVTLTNIEVVDLLPGLTWVDGNVVAELAPQETATLTATYRVSQTMIDIGKFENCAIAQADGPIVQIVPHFNLLQVGAPFAESEEACDEQTFEHDPELDLVKSGELLPNDSGRVESGDVIEYTFTVTNTGNVTVTNLEVVDLLPGLTWVGGNTIVALAPGQTAEFTATYIVSQTMIDIGEFENCAIANADVPVGFGEVDQDDVPTVASNEACDEQTFEQEPAVDASKTAGEVEGPVSVGDVIDFTITVTNTGNVTLNDVVIEDVMEGEGVIVLGPADGFTVDETDSTTGTVATIPVGGSVDVPVSYTLTQADIDAGEVENCVMTEDEAEVALDNSCVTADIPQDPDVEIAKFSETDGDNTGLVVGDVITYTFSVENTGNVTLTNITVVDPMAVEWENTHVVDRLAPGETATLTATYVVTQADVDGIEGIIVNCADITAEAPNGSAVTEDSANQNDNCATNLIAQATGIVMQVLHNCPGPIEGLDPETGPDVTFDLTVTNTGNVTLHNVTVVATRDGAFDQPFSSTFAPGQTETRVWTIVTTQEDYDLREITVEFSVTGEAAEGAQLPLASMVYMQAAQDVGDQNAITIVPLCDDDPIEKPEIPAMDPKDPKAQSVSTLPVTGSGGVAATASILWAAAMLSVVALGAGAIGIRRFEGR